MYRRADPLALDPLGPIGIGSTADIYSTTEPLALEPLSPLPAGAPEIDADEGYPNTQAKAMTT